MTSAKVFLNAGASRSRELQGTSTTRLVPSCARTRERCVLETKRNVLTLENSSPTEHAEGLDMRMGAISQRAAFELFAHVQWHGDSQSEEIRLTTTTRSTCTDD